MITENPSIEIVKKPKPIQEESLKLSAITTEDNIILAFCCDHCSYEAADRTGSLRKKYPGAFRIIRTPCTGRIEPEFILESLLHADGVLILGCHPGNCHFKVGNYEARKRYGLLRKILGEIGIDKNRVKLEWVGAGENEKFVKICNEFYNYIKSLD